MKQKNYSKSKNYSSVKYGVSDIFVSIKHIYKITSIGKEYDSNQVEILA